MTKVMKLKAMDEEAQTVMELKLKMDGLTSSEMAAKGLAILRQMGVDTQKPILMSVTAEAEAATTQVPLTMTRKSSQR